jgi:hypothetical protein
VKKPAKKTAARRRSAEPDINQLAQHLVKMSTQESGPVAVPTRSEISRVMAEMGRRGGKIGGKRRAERMTEGERSNASAMAARARWAKLKAQAR